jgi:hypothetical protein
MTKHDFWKLGGGFNRIQSQEVEGTKTIGVGWDQGDGG